MPTKIPIPIALPNPPETFAELKTAIAAKVQERLLIELEALTWKSIDKLIQVSTCIFVLSFVDGAIAVIEAKITENLPVITFLTADEIIASTLVRETLVDDPVLAHFAAKAKTEEEIARDRVKAAALAKLTPEEIATWGDSLFWNGRASYEDRVLSGQTITAITCVRGNNDIAIGIIDAAEAVGFVRNVRINGILADVVATTTEDLKSPLYGMPVATKTELAALQGRPFEVRGCNEDGLLYTWRSPLVQRLTPAPPANVGRGAWTLGNKYPGQVGDGWLLRDSAYVADTGWKQTGNFENNQIYGCRLTKGKISRITFEFSDPGDSNVFSSASYTAQNIAGWGDSQYWGGKTIFASRALSNGQTVIAVTCVRDNEDVLIFILKESNNSHGSVRNVLLNGIPSDVVALIHSHG